MEVSKLREEFLNKLQKEEYISNYLFENIKNTIPDIMMSLKGKIINIETRTIIYSSFDLHIKCKVRLMLYLTLSNIVILWQKQK